MKKQVRDYYEVEEIIRGLSPDELKGEEMPEILQQFPKDIVVLAYENTFEKKVSLEKQELEDEVVKVEEILESLDKYKFLSEEMPEELKGFSHTAIKIAYETYKISKRKNKGVFTKKQKIEEIGGYWCARDLKSSPIGNHHFFLLVVDKDMEIFGNNKVNEKDKVMFYTFGGFDKGKLKEIVNNDTDVKSVNEKTKWWKPDLDIEAHKIIEIKDEDFNNIIDKMSNYDYNQDNKGVPKYTLSNSNCASWVNVFLESIGIPQYLREKYGEFRGVDWGEEDAFDPKYFKERL